MLVLYYPSQHLNWFWVENGPHSIVLCLVAQSCVTLCNPRDHGLPCSTSPGKNAGVGCHALLQGIFPTQELKPGLPYWGQILYHLSHHSIGKLKAVGTASRVSEARTTTSGLTSIALAVYMAHLSFCMFLFWVASYWLSCAFSTVGVVPYLLTLPLEKSVCGSEATVRTGHGTTDWFQIEKGVRQDYILSPCLFNLYAEYIMKNAGLEEAQAEIKTAGRNINHLR